MTCIFLYHVLPVHVGSCGEIKRMTKACESHPGRPSPPCAAKHLSGKHALKNSECLKISERLQAHQLIERAICEKLPKSNAAKTNAASMCRSTMGCVSLKFAAKPSYFWNVANNVMLLRPCPSGPAAWQHTGVQVQSPGLDDQQPAAFVLQVCRNHVAWIDTLYTHDLSEAGCNTNNTPKTDPGCWLLPSSVRVPSHEEPRDESNYSFPEGPVPRN